MNIIKRNQSIKENESNENEMNYLLDLAMEQGEREQVFYDEEKNYEDISGI